MSGAIDPRKFKSPRDPAEIAKEILEIDLWQRPDVDVNSLCPYLLEDDLQAMIMSEADLMRHSTIYDEDNAIDARNEEYADKGEERNYRFQRKPFTPKIFAETVRLLITLQQLRSKSDDINEDEQKEVIEDAKATLEPLIIHKLEDAAAFLSRVSTKDRGDIPQTDFDQFKAMAQMRQIDISNMPNSPHNGMDPADIYPVLNIERKVVPLLEELKISLEHRDKQVGPRRN